MDRLKNLMGLGEMNFSNHLFLVDEDDDCSLCDYYACEIHSEDYWGQTVDHINELAQDLERIGWEYYSLGGYGGWDNTPRQSNIKEMTGEELKRSLFCYDTEMESKISFEHLDKDIIVLRVSHHDRPTGENLYMTKEPNLDSEDNWENPLYHSINIAEEVGLI